MESVNSLWSRKTRKAATTILEKLGVKCLGEISTTLHVGGGMVSFLKDDVYEPALACCCTFETHSILFQIDEKAQ